MILTRVRPTTLNKKRLLTILGLPRSAYWYQAQPKVKARIIDARLTGDNDLASFWSQAKTFLKRNLPGKCSCGATCGAGCLRCRMCSLAVEGRRAKVLRKAAQLAVY